MDVYKAILKCLGQSFDSNANVTPCAVSDKKRLLVFTSATDVETAESLVSAILTAEKLGKDLEAQLENIVRKSGLIYNTGLWYEGLAKILLERFESLINEGQDEKFTGAVKEACDKAKVVVQEFVHDHPILTAVAVTLLVLGLLMYAAPWAVEALGFSLEGPLEGSFAAGWQSMLGNVEARSWFAFWQRLGMTWGR